MRKFESFSYRKLMKSSTFVEKKKKMETILEMPEISHVYHTSLYSLYEKDYDNYIPKVIKKGRKFWYWDNETQRYKLITVTYTRSGVFFYTREDDNDEWTANMRSFWAMMLHPEVLDLNEYINYLNEVYNDEEFAREVLTKAEWDSCGRNVKIIPLKDKRKKTKKKK